MIESALAVSNGLSVAEVGGLSTDYSSMTNQQLNDAFILVVKEENSEEVQKLLQAGADAKTPIPYTWTSGDCDWDIETSALTYAVRCCNADLVRVLIPLENDLHEAFDMAIEDASLSVVTELIKGGADVNYVGNNGDTPLIRAVKYARPCGEFSLQAQEEATSRWWLRRDIIQVLLEAGADVSHANERGRTALMEAVVQHDLFTVRSFLKLPDLYSGSYFGFGTMPVNYADNAGNTALMLAMKNVRYLYCNSQEYNICLNSQTIVNELFELAEIDIDHENERGETALTLLDEYKEKMSRYRC